MNVTTNEKPEVDKIEFLLQWMAFGVLVWPVTFAISSVALTVVVVVCIFPIRFIQAYELVSVLRAPEMIISYVAFGASSGFCIGLIQQRTLKRYLSWMLPDWKRYSAIGGMVGGLALFFILYLLPETSFPHQNLLWQLPMPLYMLGVGSAQWLALRHQTTNAWAWITGNVIAGFAFVGFLNLFPIVSIFALPMAIFSQGLITGAVMLWLFRHSISLQRHQATSHWNRATVTMMKKTFSQTYIELCSFIENRIVDRLARPLTAQEKCGIWNAGSLMMLETIERSVSEAKSPEQIASELSKLAQSFEPNLPSLYSNLATEIGKLLTRTISDVELQKLNAARSIEPAIKLISRLETAAIENREQLVQEFFAQI